MSLFIIMTRFLENLNVVDVVVMLLLVIITIFLIIIYTTASNNYDRNSRDDVIIVTSHPSLSHQALSRQPSQMTTNSARLILYYADYCGHCKNFMPTWKQLKEGNDLPGITFEEFDCVAQQNVCASNGITGYPTIVLSKADGSKVQYPPQPRTYNMVVDFVKKNL